MMQPKPKNILAFSFNVVQVDHFKEYRFAKNLKDLKKKEKKIAFDILIMEFHLL